MSIFNNYVGYRKKKDKSIFDNYKGVNTIETEPIRENNKSKATTKDSVSNNKKDSTKIPNQTMDKLDRDLKMSMFKANNEYQRQINKEKATPRNYDPNSLEGVIDSTKRKKTIEELESKKSNLTNVLKQEAEKDKDTVKLYNPESTKKAIPYLAEKAKAGLMDFGIGIKKLQESLQPNDMGFKSVEDRAMDNVLRQREDFARAESKNVHPALKFTGDVVSGITQMIPTVMAGAASGGATLLPTAMMSMSAAGQGYNEALTEGATKEQARAYGLTVGTIEGAVESLIGGLPFMKGIGDKALSRVVSPIKNKAARTIVKGAIDAVGEGGEEIITEILTPLAKRQTYNQSAELATGKDIARAFLLGATVAGVLNTPVNLANMRSSIENMTEPERQQFVEEQEAILEEGLVNISDESDLQVSEFDGKYSKNDIQTEDYAIKPKDFVTKTKDIVTKQASNVNTMPMAERTVYNVGDRKVNAYQYDNPEVKLHVQAYANYILSNEFSVASAQVEPKTEAMKKLKEYTNASYKDIGKALESIMKDEGAENYSIAKKVELAIDDMLTNGFTAFDGNRFPSDVEYLEKKSMIEGKEIVPEDNSIDWSEVGANRSPMHNEMQPLSAQYDRAYDLATDAQSLTASGSSITQKMNNHNDNKNNNNHNDIQAYKNKDSLIKAKLNTEAFNDSSEPVRRSDIVDFVAKYLDIPVESGKYRVRRALGIYKVKPEIIRLKKDKDIETLYHEMGHHLDKQLGLSEGYKESYREYIKVKQAYNLIISNPNLSEGKRIEWENKMKVAEKKFVSTPLKEMIDSLPEAFTDLYENNELAGEAVAEFMRHFIIDEKRAKELAPKFYQQFISKVVKDQQFIDFVRTLQAATANYINQNSEARILSNISTHKSDIIGIDLERLYTLTIDNLKPLDRVVNSLTGGHEISENKNPYTLAWLFRGWQGKAQTFLEYGVVDENLNKKGKSFREVLEPIKGELDKFRAYTVAKRAKELRNRKIFSGIEPKDVDSILAMHNSKYEKVLQDLIEYQDNVLEQLKEQGILSGDSIKNMRKLNENYVPFYRVIEEVNNRQKKGKGAGKGYQAYNPIKGIKGSDKDIIDPLESIIKNTYMYINLAERNRVGKSLVELGENFEGYGKFFEKIPTPMKGTTFNVKEIEGALSEILEDSGVDTAMLDLDKIATIFRPSHYGKDQNVYTVFRNGKPEYYQIHDIGLYTALKALDKESTNIVLEIMAAPAKLLRTGATLTPEFVARNPIRDMWSAWVFSKYGFIPVVDTIKGMSHALKKSDVYYKWMASGGAQSAMVSMDRDYMQGSLRKLIPETMKSKYGSYKREFAKMSNSKKAFEIAKLPFKIVDLSLEPLRALSELSEYSTRLGEFAKGVKKEGATSDGYRKAALASRDVTIDFARGGTATKQINKVIAFFNAAIQGTDKMVRSFKSDPIGTAVRATIGITLPSIITYLLFHDDEKYKEVPQWMKDTFWIIPIGDKVIRIPKPFDMGLIFGTVPERFLQFVKENDKEAFNGLLERFKDTFTPAVIPTIFLPYIEAKTNYSIFKQHSIVPQSQQNLEAWAQYSVYTSDTARLLGKAFNKSPRIIENTIYGYSGGLGRLGVDFLDVVLELTGAVEKKKLPKKTVEDLPILKGFMTRPFEYAQSIDTLYDRLDVLRKKYNTYGKEEMNVDEYREYKLLDSASSDLSKLRKVQAQTYENTNLTPEAKREKIDELMKQMAELAEKALNNNKE